MGWLPDLTLQPWPLLMAGTGILHYLVVHWQLGWAYQKLTCKKVLLFLSPVRLHPRKWHHLPDCGSSPEARSHAGFSSPFPITHSHMLPPHPPGSLGQNVLEPCTLHFMPALVVLCWARASLDFVLGITGVPEGFFLNSRVIRFFSSLTLVLGED